MRKHRGLIALAAVLALGVAYIAGIMLFNNYLASRMEKALLEYPLPPGTRVVASGNIAGKVRGNGNGMQWYGMLLVESDLPEEELEAYYTPLVDENNVDVDVHTGDGHRQPTVNMAPGTPNDFGWVRCDYGATGVDLGRCWQIQLERLSVVGAEREGWEVILNSDPRAH